MGSPIWWLEHGADGIRSLYRRELEACLDSVYGFVRPLMGIVVDYLCEDVGPHLSKGRTVEVCAREVTYDNWRELDANRPVCCRICKISKWIQFKIKDRRLWFCCGSCDRREIITWTLRPIWFSATDNTLWVEGVKMLTTIDINDHERHRFAAPQTHLTHNIVERWRRHVLPETARSVWILESHILKINEC